MMGWETAVTTVTGVLVTLLGVAVGGWISNRSQNRAWSRSVLADACTALLQEQARTYMALVRWRFKEVDRVDWAGWNAALARLQLVAAPTIVEAALRLDRAFWQLSTGIRGNIDDAKWCELRDEVEERRLDFVNVARRQFSPSAVALRSLIAKPNETSETAA